MHVHTCSPMNRHRTFSASLSSCANYNKIHSQRPPHVAGSACAPQAYSLDDEPLPCRSPFHNRDPPRAARSPPRSPRSLDEAAVVAMKRRKPQSRSLASATHASLPSSHRCNVAERARPGSARAALSRALWCSPLRTEIKSTICARHWCALENASSAISKSRSLMYA